MHFNWLAKTELRGGLVVNIVVNYCCKRKMLEESEETIGFFVTFLSLVTFPLGVGGRAPCFPGYTYVLGSILSEMRKFLETSEAEFNLSVGAGMDLKPSGTHNCKVYPLFLYSDLLSLRLALLSGSNSNARF